MYSISKNKDGPNNVNISSESLVQKRLLPQTYEYIPYRFEVIVFI